MVHALVKKGVVVLSIIELNGKQERRIDLGKTTNLEYLVNRGYVPSPSKAPLEPTEPSGTTSIDSEGCETNAEKAPTISVHGPTEPLQSVPDDNPQLPLDLNTASKPALDRIKTLEQIRQIQVQTSRARGDLIDRDLVRRLLLQLLSIDNSQFMHMSDDLTGRIIAEIQIERIFGMLPSEQRATLGFDMTAINAQVNATIDLAINNVLIQKEKMISDFLNYVGSEAAVDDVA